MPAKTYCEIYAKYMLPAIRAYLSRELVLKYGLSQFRVSKILGVKQSAVNYFVKGTRKPRYISIVENTKEFREMLDALANQLAKGSPFDKCYICNMIHNNSRVLETILQAFAREKIIGCKHIEAGVS
ncbi:MAG: hypothetical protein QXO48_06450 [Desulfurococcaceae archaeon]